MKKFYTIKTLQDLDSIAQELFSLKDSVATYTFSGPLGAGKTTLCQKLLKNFGVQENVVSPTYAYLNIYKNGQCQHFYHFDLYRFENIVAFSDAGFDEYLNKKNSWAFIEWPEIVLPFLKNNVCNIYIDYEQEGERKIYYQTI